MENKIDNVKHRKAHGLTTIKTAEKTIPVFKLFMLICLFGKYPGTQRKLRKIEKLSEFSKIEIDMVKLSFFDMKFFLAILKEIDDRLEVNEKLKTDAVLNVSFTKIYERMGLDPIQCKTAEKRERSFNTIVRLSKISMQYNYSENFYAFTIFQVMIENFGNSIDNGFKTPFENMQVTVSKSFVESHRKASEKFIGMIDIPFLEKLGPVASNLYMYILANSGFDFISRSTLIERLDLTEYTEEKHKNQEIKKAFERLEKEGIVKNIKFVNDSVNKRILKQVNFNYIKPKTESAKEKIRTINNQNHNDFFANRLNKLNENVDLDKKFDMLEFLFDKDSN
ncbi:TPA: hypothetical protein ACKTGI_003482 [Pseudomonas aeruginosa]